MAAIDRNTDLTIHNKNNKNKQINKKKKHSTLQDVHPFIIILMTTLPKIRRWRGRRGE
jgi:hypothetical protein